MTTKYCLGENIAKFGRYFILDKVYEGIHTKIFRALLPGEEGGKLVAIKYLKKEYKDDESITNQFFKGVKIAFELNCPNIVQTFDYGEVSGRKYTAMEYVEGRDLQFLINKHKSLEIKIPLNMAIYIMSQVTHALTYTYHFKNPLTEEDRRVIHRKLYPHNILVSYSGEVKIVDYCGHEISDLTKGDGEASYSDLSRYTYMAPESFEGEGSSEMFDTYAVGALLWELVCMRPLWQKEFKSLEDFREMIKNEKIQSPREINNEVTEFLEGIILKCLALDPGERYKNIQYLERDLIKALYACDKDFTNSELNEHMHEIFKNEIDLIAEDNLEIGQLHEEVKKKYFKTRELSSRPYNESEETVTTPPARNPHMEKTLIIGENKDELYKSEVEKTVKKEIGNKKVIDDEFFEMDDFSDNYTGLKIAGGVVFILVLTVFYFYLR